MRFENGTSNRDKGAALDFSRRANLSERMDEPCSYEEFRACLHSLELSNRLTFTYRPTLGWLERFESVSRPLHLLDVGSGGGDMLRRIERWTAKKGLNWSLTGIDLNPHAERAAREFTPAGSRIEWITGDVCSYEPNRPVDLIINSLFMHHLPEGQIPPLLRWMESRAEVGWFINDLYRGPVPYHFYRWFAGAMGFHAFVRHDGPISIRRSFRDEDWKRLCTAASLPLNEVQVRPVWPARLCVAREKRIA